MIPGARDPLQEFKVPRVGTTTKLQKGKSWRYKPSWWFLATHLKNMRKSNWIMKPQVVGMNIKYVWVART